MLHHAPFGIPTPPASPSYDNQKNFSPQSNTYAGRQLPQQRQQRCIPLAPEARLGMVLDGNLQLREILGTGAYGVVYLAYDINTGVRYAVKCLSKFNNDGTPLERRQVAYQQREIRLHYLASAHANVVSMLKITDAVDCIYVILEYCPEGDLFSNITEGGRYVAQDDLAKRAFLQILDAVEHCHKLGVYHRDLKPENILVTDNGNTVKLADFGLATSDDRSEDYGCGSTFYMSPECLDPSTRKPYYMCSPNDVWSMGVILVNLTCGRNPWKQASLQDSTYRAYIQSPGFLKTILPLSDELNEILGRIFEPKPEHRITLAELRQRIIACPRFTIPAAAPASIITPPATPPPFHQTTEYVLNEEAIADDYAVCLSPEGSLTSDASTIEEMDEDMLMQEYQQQVPVPFDTDFAPRQHYAEQVPVVPSQAPRVPVQVPTLLSHQPHVQQQQSVCQPKSYFPLWDVVKYVQQVPVMQQHHQFHPQVSFLPSFQGIY